MPNASFYLEPASYNYSEGPLIEFDSDIEYRCADGKRFAKDFSLQTENATCRVNNTWDEPIGGWSQCIDSN